MAFPQTPLDVLVELQLGGSWVDITSDVYLRDPISITWGRADEGSRADTSKCKLQVNNRTGKYSPRNWNSPYYGLLGRNTPVRISVTTPNGVVSRRYVGEISEWPARWDVSQKDVWVTVQASGIMRRLGQGKAPLLSALRRYIEASNPAAYWPLTDGANARAGGELIGASLAMRAVPAGQSWHGQPGWGTGTLASWMEPVLQMGHDTTGRLTTGTTAPGVGGVWAVDFVRAGVGGTEFVLMRDTGRGTDTARKREWQLAVNFPNVGEITIILTEIGETTSPDTTLETVAAATLNDGAPHQLRWEVDSSGGSTAYALYMDGEALVTNAIAVNTDPLSTFDYFWNTETVPGADTGTIALGHVTYWGATRPTAAESWRAMRGWESELAGRRIERLCAEQSVALDAIGNLDLTEPMGPQNVGRFLDLLREAELADGGVLHESRDELALAYRTRTSKYNQT